MMMTMMVIEMMMTGFVMLLVTMYMFALFILFT